MREDNHPHRITPARAGKTPSRSVRCSLQKDHPRACGENGRYSRAVFSEEGSPPRVRGKRGLIAAAVGPTRITPARAGKTFRPLLFTLRLRDHPRACGENVRASAHHGRGGGSPPRVRGKHLEAVIGRGLSRITPARAGKTPLVYIYSISFVGSPPRVRGKHGLNRAFGFVERITPARAGKTKQEEYIYGDTEDHPRACGENWAGACIQSVRAGSPPRVRGKRIGMLNLRVTGGITPARAGKTKTWKRHKVTGEDHPRACGENRRFCRRRNP